MKTYNINIDFKIVIYSLLTIIGIYFAYILKGVILIIFLAFIINAAVRPILTTLQKKGLKRWISILIIYLFIIIFIIFFSYIFLHETYNQIKSFIHALQNNSKNLSNFIQNFLPFLSKNDIDKFITSINLPSFNTSNSSETVTLSIQAFNFLGIQGLSLLSDVFGGIASIIVIIVISIYMTLSEENFHDTILNIFHNNKLEKLSKIISKIQIALGSWLIGQLLLMFIMGFLSYIVVVIPRIFDSNYELYKYAIIIGIIAGVLEALPNVGPIVTLILSLLLTILSGASIPIIVYIFIIHFAIQELEAWIIVPAIMKKAIDIHPILSILGILVGFELAGPIGALISIPIIGMLQVIFNEIIKNQLPESVLL